MSVDLFGFPETPEPPAKKRGKPARPVAASAAGAPLPAIAKTPARLEAPAQAPEESALVPVASPLVPAPKFEPPAPHVYSVSEVTRSVRDALEAAVGTVWVEGEISNYRKQSSGHQYFTLKDAQSQ